MSEGAPRPLYLDLDADNRAKRGVVVDVRHNNGGFVNVYAIDVLARRGYLTMTPRGLPSAPARTLLGQRSLELPTIPVTNQRSLSDAEDFTEGYRTLKLGKVVGEPTSGWIIFTGSQTLIDGTSTRMPGTRITSNDGMACVARRGRALPPTSDLLSVLHDSGGRRCGGRMGRLVRAHAGATVDGKREALVGLSRARGLT